MMLIIIIIVFLLYTTHYLSKKNIIPWNSSQTHSKQYTVIFIILFAVL